MRFHSIFYSVIILLLPKKKNDVIVFQQIFPSREGKIDFLFIYILCHKLEKASNQRCRTTALHLLITALVPKHFLPILLCFFVCSICAVGPSGEGKWDHNLNVSVLKTMPAECYSLTAFMATLHSLSDHRCAWVALGCFESPSSPIQGSPVVRRNVPRERCLNYSGMSG